MRRICVFAGARAGVRAGYRQGAEALGALLARRGIGIVYGGGRIGLMGALADAALEAGGQVIGVIPRALVTREVAHDGLSDLRIVSSMHERKATMADLSDAFIALPGGWGTLEELFEIITWAQLGLHDKPCGLLNLQGYFDPLLAFVQHSIDEDFLDRQTAGLLTTAASADALVEQLVAHRSAAVEKWIDRSST